MSSGERPIGAAKGKQPNPKALCQTPPPPECRGGGRMVRLGEVVALAALAQGHPTPALTTNCRRGGGRGLGTRLFPP